MMNFLNIPQISFTAWPEMLAWPYLMLQGWLPYRDIAIAHNPLLLFDLVVFYKLFGIGIVQLKIYTWLLIAVNAYLTFFVASKYLNKKIGYVSILVYLLLCIVFQGNGLWFDLALAPFGLLLYFCIQERKYFWSGIVFALGFLTKQTFIWFLIPVAYIVLKDIKRLKIYLPFVYGVFSILILFIGALYLFGIADDFYFWAIKFGILYLPNAAGQLQFPSIKEFGFAMLPFAAILVYPEIFPWVVAGSLGVYPRWELFHFQPALPFLAITISSLFANNKINLFKIITLILFIWHISIGIERVSGSNTRFYEPQVRSVVNEIKKRNSREIYVANYWDNIYALTHTIPATKPLIPYIPWYIEYGDTKNIIMNNLKVKMPESIIIGERDNNFPEFYDFVSRFYSCNIVTEKVELCDKNK